VRDASFIATTRPVRVGTFKVVEPSQVRLMEPSAAAYSSPYVLPQPLDTVSSHLTKA
jgi:hypothetical protein